MEAEVRFRCDDNAILGPVTAWCHGNWNLGFCEGSYRVWCGVIDSPSSA